MRTNKADIEQRIRNIERRFNVKLAVDWMAGRPRIERADHQRYLSPRGTTAEIVLWLDGFIEALELNGLDVERDASGDVVT